MTVIYQWQLFNEHQVDLAHTITFEKATKQLSFSIKQFNSAGNCTHKPMSLTRIAHKVPKQKLNLINLIISTNGKLIQSISARWNHKEKEKPKKIKDFINAVKIRILN